MASFIASVVGCCTTSIVALWCTFVFIVGLYGAVQYGLYGGLSGGSMVPSNMWLYYGL